jgi:hypothetical protein
MESISIILWDDRKWWYDIPTRSEKQSRQVALERQCTTDQW